MLVNASKCIIVSLISALSWTAASESQFKSDHHQCTENERLVHPHLCVLLDYKSADPIHLANELHRWSRDVGFIFDMTLNNDLPTVNQNRDALPSILAARAATASKRQMLRAKESAVVDRVALPTVVAHGMGDSCFNSGMIHFTSHISTLTSTYAQCIPTGSTQHTDTMNGFFLNMDASVDIFASQIQSIPQFKDGFNAIGLSQGNNIIRGYIAKYNDPPVNTFISANGVNGGTGAVPYCIPKVSSTKVTKTSSDAFSSGRICNGLMEVASKRAYSTFAQTHSFQANYWRDPRPQAKEAYATYSQLAQWNNEGRVYNSTLNENYAKTQKFVWVMALQDEMVWPKEGEQWGAPNPLHPFDGENNILDREETEWFVKDLFGLKTAEEAGKNHYESFDGPHLGFSTDDINGWVNKYFNV